MNAINYIHIKYAYNRRVRLLAEYLAELTPQNARVLDVGCGDGLIAHLIMQNRPDIRTEGLDILIRKDAYIPVSEFDGRKIPYADNTFDVVRFVDVLHHTIDPLTLLREAARVTRQAVIIKDHTRDGLLAETTLRFMDWVGNSRHGVVLPYNFWPEETWLKTFADLGLRITSWRGQLNLYSPPLGLLFDRSLHFISRLEVK